MMVFTFFNSKSKGGSTLNVTAKHSIRLLKEWIVFKAKEVYRYIKIPDHTINGAVEVVVRELNDEVPIPTIIHNNNNSRHKH